MILAQIRYKIEVSTELMLFIFDRSPVARLIKTIDSGDRTIEKLRQLVDIMVCDIDKMPYNHMRGVNLIANY